MGYAMADDDPARGGAGVGVGRGAYSRELAERVRALAVEGLGRAEIAVALGLWPQEVSERQADDAQFAAAMAWAEQAARAWWEAAPREAMAAGGRFNAAGWLSAMRWRYGAGQDGAGQGGAVGTAGEPAAAQPKVRFYIPYNGRLRQMPDGRPMTPALHREYAMGEVQAEIDRVEASLADWRRSIDRAEAELAEWREELSEVSMRNWDPDMNDDDWDYDPDDEGDGDEDDADADDDDDDWNGNHDWNGDDDADDETPRPADGGGADAQ